MQIDFQRYLGYEELTSVLQEMAGEYTGLCDIVSVGKSHEGRDIWLAEITDKSSGPVSEKPAFWVDGNTHAGEVTGSMSALHLIHTLLEGYGNDERITNLLERQAFYVLPCLSPDGAERYLTTPYTLRASTRPWPEPEEQPGLHFEDIDGDGHILQMRLEDENGEWKVSERDERLMIPRGPDEYGGTYYRLYREGLFRDYDGFERKIAPPLQGLDMNRQYPYEWREENAQRGAGPYPLSEPESRAHVEAVLARKNVFSAHTYHTFSGVILRPFSDKEDLEMPEHDLAVYESIGSRGTEITGYPAVSVYHGFRYSPRDVITGAFDDWAYSSYGAFAFTIEFWSLARSAGVEIEDFIELFRRPTEEQQLKMLAWNDTELDGEGFVPWTPFEHPQLGQVEIGGWKPKFTFQNPPPKFLENECGKLTEFALAHASTAPRLEAKLAVEEIGDGLRQIEVRVENTGYLPTNVSQIAVNKELVKPVEAEIRLPEGASLVSGETKTELGHLSGRSSLTGNQWRNPYFWQGLPSEYARRTVWVVHGGGRVEIEVRSEKAGTVRLKSE